MDYCDFIDPIIDTECVGDSLTKINANFLALQDRICNLLTNLLPTGIIIPFPALAPPDGWILCDGSYITEDEDTLALCNLLGDRYGPIVGDTYKLPDPRGRTIVGAGTGIGLTARTLADIGGTETVALTTNQNAAHTHTITDPGHTHPNSTAAAHTHGATLPEHKHTATASAHNHNIYFGHEAPLTAGTEGPRAATQDEKDWGELYAVGGGTSVFLHGHTLDPTGAYWLQGPTNPGGGAIRLTSGGTNLNYWIKDVAANTTADPLQVTIETASAMVINTTNAAAIAITTTSTSPAFSTTSQPTGITINSTGSGAAHNNMQPFLALNYIIKL